MQCSLYYSDCAGACRRTLFRRMPTTAVAGELPQKSVRSEAFHASAHENYNADKRILYT